MTVANLIWIFFPLITMTGTVALCVALWRMSRPRQYVDPNHRGRCVRRLDMDVQKWM